MITDVKPSTDILFPEGFEDISNFETNKFALAAKSDGEWWDIHLKPEFIAVHSEQNVFFKIFIKLKPSNFDEMLKMIKLAFPLNNLEMPADFLILNENGKGTLYHKTYPGIDYAEESN